MALGPSHKVPMVTRWPLNLLLLVAPMNHTLSVSIHAYHPHASMVFLLQYREITYIHQSQLASPLAPGVLE